MKLSVATYTINVQVSESTAVHRAEEQSAKVMRLEAVLLRIEQERDGLSERLFHSRAEAHKRTKHLRTTVQVSYVYVFSLGGFVCLLKVCLIATDYNFGASICALTLSLSLSLSLSPPSTRHSGVI